MPTLDVAAGVDAVRAIARDLGRDDFAQRLSVALARVRRPTTIVCVVGEFKQGKSSLVNALLGQDVCPVDDDIATSAITLLRYGAEPVVEVRRRTDGGEVVVEQVEPAALAEWVSERGNPDNVKGVERVDIALPNPLLASGLAIVDTPGMGGLGAGHAAATLAFLPFADGLVFVTDASAELSEPEAEFLARAHDLCPNVLFVLSKTDLYPAWRRIAAIDETHRRHDRDRPILPVSSALLVTDGAAGDDSLAEASGIPDLLGTLEHVIVAPAKDVAAQRALDEASGVLDQMDHQLRTELEVLDDPARLADVVARYTAATAHLELLRGPGARWSVLVADRISDLSNSSGFEFRKAMRTVSRDTEDAIELLKSPEDWQQLARKLQTDVADAVTNVFVGIERGAQTTREAVVELIGEDAADVMPRSSRREGLELSALWSDRGIDPTARHRGTAQLGSAFAGLRGAQSGIVMFGMVGRFLPKGAAVLMMSNPVTIGIGAAFAGMQLADARKRKVALRRQQARTNVRQFMDEVQFAVGNEISEVMRDVQRGIRDEFTERISELMRTYAEGAQQAQRAAQDHSGTAKERGTALRSALERVAEARLSLVPA